MKIICKSILALLFLLTIQNQSLLADHGMGGELTWRCLGTGEYVFKMKLYRDCNGINAPLSVNISTTVPGMPSIFAPRISITDISPKGFLNDGTSPCPSCANTTGSPVGVVEEHIYESSPVTLNGVPPTQGWDFFWGECCRSYAITNVVNPGSIGFRLHAKMFSYNGQNADPCFDSSPSFAERPNFIVCSNLPFVYNHLSSDTEFDSLTYEFTEPLDESGIPVTFASGYSVNSPLPGSSILNSQTGEFFSAGSLGGYYVTTIKVSSFKCGVKVAEIIREVNIVIVNNCPTIFNGVINTPPLVNAPFMDPVTQLYTSYADTVIAGDVVNFNINITDFEFFNNGSAQLIDYMSYGLQYGDSFSNAASGCLIPPCATLSPPPPLVNQIAAVVGFNWQTTTAHLGYSFSCVQFNNTYYFVNRTQDNYCPANGMESRVFSITVETAMLPPPVNNNGGVLECPLGAGYVYQWFYNRFAIPGANTSSYTPVQPGIYQVLAVAQNGDGNYSEGYNYNPVGIYENVLFSSVSIYPNPGKDGIFHVSFNMEQTQHMDLVITDVLGKLVLTKEIVAKKGVNTFDIDLSSSANGVYTFEMRVEKIKSNFYKLMKSE